jgi:uncharacterized protein YndB with AHSA1/START domain
MSAIGEDQIEYMKQAGMPITTQNQVRFTEVERPHRLAYKELADFIPGVEPYEVDTVVELHELPGAVRMVLTFESMHDDHWTKLMVMGREGELVRLARLLEARS